MRRGAGEERYYCVTQTQLDDGFIADSEIMDLLGFLFWFLDSEPFREHAVRGGESDEEDEGEPARAQEYQSSHYGGLPVYLRET